MVKNIKVKGKVPPAKADPTKSPARAKPEVEVAEMTSTRTEVLEESHVYVHCYFNNTHTDMLMRIWKTTFLIDKASGARSGLVHAENISYAPQWTSIPNNSRFRFLLIFSALPKSCVQFDLLEEIPQSGGFYIPDIQRNEQDVYHVDII